MSNLLESKKVRTILWALGGLIILFVVFGLGITVGYDRAGFSTGFDKNYFRIFYGGSLSGSGGMGALPAPPMPAAIHGVVGTVIDITDTSLSVKDQENNEQSVAISSGTVIRSGDNTISLGDIPVGANIAVIGEPNSDGQIAARFIRVFSASSSTPPQSPTPGTPFSH